MEPIVKLNVETRAINEKFCLVTLILTEEAKIPTECDFVVKEQQRAFLQLLSGMSK